jgi:DNA-binding SARP family transcriptional activator
MPIHPVVLSIELFGTLRVTCCGHSKSFPPSSKNGALLAYLALYASEAHAREMLAHRIWPETDDPRGNLRKALSNLREEWKRAGLNGEELFIASRDYVRLNPRAFTTDVQEFLALLQAAAEAEDRERTVCLAKAVDLYRSDLLEDSEERWIDGLRRKLHDRAVSALDALVAAHEQNGDLPGAIECALKAIELDGCKEGNYLRLMRLYAEFGQTTAVEACWQMLKRRLSQQGLTPSDETLAQYEALRFRMNGAKSTANPDADLTLSSVGGDLPVGGSHGLPYIVQSADLGNLQSADALRDSDRDIHRNVAPVRIPRRMGQVAWIAASAIVALAAWSYRLHGVSTPGSNSSAVPAGIPAGPFPPRLIPRQVFDSDRGGRRHLVLLNVDGTQTQLTSGPSIDDAPKFSPNGDRVVFHSERDGTEGIYILDRMSGSVRPLTQGVHDANPCWSPDGKRIAFARQQDKYSSIWVINVDGTGAKRISSPAILSADYPSWSHDGSRIAFTGYLVPVKAGAQSQGILYVMNANGTGLRFLSTLSGENTVPSWSPGDRLIAFVLRPAGDVWTVASDGSALTRVTSRVNAYGPAAWSPDGSRVACSAGSSIVTNLYVLDLKTRRWTQTTNGHYLECRPNWFPRDPGSP